MNSCFTEVASFSFVVPANYVHKEFLESFLEHHRNALGWFHRSIKQENFSTVTSVLVPNQKIRVRVLAPKEVVLPEDCLAYLINEKALLVGIQGLALAYQEGNLSLPREAWHLSFDRKEVLFDYVGPRVPYIYIHPAGQFDFDLLPFKDGCAPGQTLLCFT